jgi:hypothetical protein
MFKLFNEDPYAISNNIRLGLQLITKNVHFNHNGLEKNVLQGNSIKDDEDDGLGRVQVFDVNKMNLTRYLYSRPKLSFLIDHCLSNKTNLIFEPPYEDWLFLTIRGILDSKYFEMLLNEDSLSYYKSSRFVGKFRIYL